MGQKKQIVYLCIGVLAGLLGSQSFTLAEPIKEFVLHSAAYKLTVNGKAYESLDLPILNYEGNTYVPLKAVGDLIGAGVQWNEERRQVEMAPFTPLTNNASFMLNDFEVNLFADKTIYTSNEPIKIWAIFKYTGTQEEIKIGHAADYMDFRIIQMDGSLEFVGAMALPYITSIIKKDVEYRKNYRKSVGFVSNDPNAEIYTNFAMGSDVKLPPGTYKITASAHFNIEDSQEDLSKKVTLTIPTEILIKVTQ